MDNKHNIKNDRYQFIGGSNAAVIGNYYIDTNLLLMAKVSSELIAPKDFASDKKVEQLFSHKTLSLLEKGINESKVTGLDSNYGALCATWYFARLHLYAVNGISMPAKHRAMYLGISMF